MVVHLYKRVKMNIICFSFSNAVSVLLDNVYQYVSLVKSVETKKEFWNKLFYKKCL